MTRCAHRLLASVLLATLARAQATPAEQSCAVCHGEEGRTEVPGAHAAAGIGCVACHGGVAGPLTADEAHATGVRVPRGSRATVELCGGCHADAERMRGFRLRTDQLLLYETSGHGKRLAAEDDPNVATCVSCHGAHGVLPASDPRSPVHALRQLQTCGRCHADAELMQRYELPADVPELYRGSVHGHALLERGALSSPACTTCHGSHGATPPGVDEVGRTCGRCHTPAREHFERGPHLAPARDGTIEECVSCHGSHAVAPATEALFVGSEAGHCGSCHQRDARALEVASNLHAQLTGLDGEVRSAENALSEAARSGLFVERESDRLAQARALRGRAVPLVHALSPQALSDRLEPGRGMVAETLGGLEKKRRELDDRKVLVLVFFVVVLCLAGVLLVHAREVAGRATGAPGSFEGEADAELREIGRG